MKKLSFLIMKDKYPWLIQTGICQCGHSYEEHHLSVIMNEDTMREIAAINPEHPPYLPGECEHFGFNECGGRDRDGNEHCYQYKE